MSLSEYFKRSYILIVDDQMNMRKTVRNMLRVLDIQEFREAEDGKKALEILNETASGGGKISCGFILTDWNMKRMDGPEFVKEVRGNKKFENTPILMITANPDPDFVTQAIECGVNGYMIKPLTAKDLENKISGIMEARAHPPEHVKLINRGEELLAQKMFREALEQFEQALRLVPSSSRVLVLLGEVYEKMKSFNRARVFYDKASEINPNYIKAHTMKAQFFINRGDSSAALESLERAAKISPNNSDRQVTIGTIYLDDGRVEKAKGAFELAVKVDSAKNKEVGESFLKAGRAKDAEFFFRESLKQNQDNLSREEKEEVTHTYNRLGIALRKQGRWNDAVEEYRLALKMTPNDEVLFYNMGKAHLEGGERENAKKCFKKAILIDPDFQEAKKELDELAM